MKVHDKFLQDIKDFHVKFGLEYIGPPRELKQKASLFRQHFMQEELDEYHNAVRAGDLAEQFDALIDLVYVALGTAYMQGLPFEPGWDRVHYANMLKVRVTGAGMSKRDSDLDVGKPSGWVPPYLGDLVNAPES